MAPDRKQLIVLGVLLAVLAVTLYFTAFPRTAGSAASASNGRSTRASRDAQPSITAPEVKLSLLTAERPRPSASSRNLFRFRQPPAPPAPPPVTAPPVAAAPPAVAGPPPVPAPPPIPLRLVMTFTQGTGPRFATLSDTFGRQVSGKEGDTLEGRYRIMRVSESSVELSYLDGRGRQTIRAGQ